MAIFPVHMSYEYLNNQATGPGPGPVSGTKKNWTLTGTSHQDQKLLVPRGSLTITLACRLSKFVQPLSETIKI